MPLCTPDQVKGATGARIDGAEFDAGLPDLIAAATRMIEQQCRVPAGHFDANPSPTASRCCIALCVAMINDPADTAALDSLLSGGLLWADRQY